MARCGREVYVVADSSKLGLGRSTRGHGGLALPWPLVTDDGADPRRCKSSGARGEGGEEAAEASA